MWKKGDVIEQIKENGLDYVGFLAEVISDYNPGCGNWEIRVMKLGKSPNYLDQSWLSVGSITTTSEGSIDHYKLLYNVNDINSKKEKTMTFYFHNMCPKNGAIRELANTATLQSAIETAIYRGETTLHIDSITHTITRRDFTLSLADNKIACIKEYRNCHAIAPGLKESKDFIEALLRLGYTEIAFRF